MSKLNYQFAAIPLKFIINGMIKNHNAFIFMSWCISKCSNEVREVVESNTLIKLEPYQFIFKLKDCSEETGLTFNKVRTQQKNMSNNLYIEKSTNKTTNKFTIYRLLTDSFSIEDHKQNHKQTTNKPQTEPIPHNNNLDIQKKDIDNARRDDSPPASQPPRQKDSLSFSFELKKFIGIEKEDLEAWKICYPHVELGQEILKATQWIISNPSKSKKKLWRLFLTKWFNNQNEKIENKKAYASLNKPSFGFRDKRNVDIHGNPITSEASTRF